MKLKKLIIVMIAMLFTILAGCSGSYESDVPKKEYASENVTKNNEKLTASVETEVPNEKETSEYVTFETSEKVSVETTKESIEKATAEEIPKPTESITEKATEKPTEKPTEKVTQAQTVKPTVAPTQAVIERQTTAAPAGTKYVLNTNSKKFHYPSCSSVKTIKSSNRRDYTGSRESVTGMGYVPCKRCNP